MALKDKWTNKRDEVDYILAEDINNIAEEVIDTQENTYTKTEVDTKLKAINDTVNDIGFSVTGEKSDRESADNILSQRIYSTELDIYNLKNTVSNIDTKDINDELAKASNVIARKTISLSGDILTEKTSDNIYLVRATPNDEVVFGQSVTITQQYMGHVGIKNLSAGNYVLVAQMDMSVNGSGFDENEVDVSVCGFYRVNGTEEDKPTGLNAGTLKFTGVERHPLIIYPFTAWTNSSIHGFYMEAPKSITANITLRNIQLFKPTSIYNNKSDLGIDIYGTKFLTEQDTILEMSSSDGGFTYDVLPCKSVAIDIKSKTARPVYATSLSGAIRNKDIIIYESIKETYASKTDISSVTSMISEKGVKFDYSSTTYELENGCMYYIRSNTSEKNLWLTADDSVVTDTDGNNLSEFKEAMIMTSDNLFEEAVYQHIIFMPSTLSLTSKAFQIKPNAKLAINFVTGASGEFSVWKIKA